MSKISVIMPVYNVEKYVSTAIKSVLSQDFYDFELIIIIDGSTDQSENIVRKYAAVDKRIKVYTKANGGISSARNRGLDVMKGEYIYFLDSDDFMAKRALSTLYDAAQEAESDIATAQFNWISENHIHNKYSNDKTAAKPCKLYQGAAALEASLYENAITLYAWGKLMHRDTFKGIRFPENMIFEDTAVMYKVLLSANKIAVCDDILYHYVKREGSLSNSSFDIRRMHHLIFAKEMYGYVLGYHKSIEKSAEYYLFMVAFFIYAKLLDENLHKKYAQEFRDCESTVAMLSKSVSKNPYARPDIKRFAHVASRSTPLLSVFIKSKRILKHGLRIMKINVESIHKYVSMMTVDIKLRFSGLRIRNRV